MDDDEYFDANEPGECIKVRIKVGESVDEIGVIATPKKQKENEKGERETRRKRRRIALACEEVDCFSSSPKRQLALDDSEPSTTCEETEKNVIYQSNDNINDNDTTVNNEEDALLQQIILIPAAQQTFHTTSVKTASVTAVAKTTVTANDDWVSHDHSYDSSDSERRQLIGRTGLENLKTVVGVPQKAAAFLEQFTEAAHSGDDQVRCEVLEYLPHMALLLSEDVNNQQLKSLISSHILPTVAVYLADHAPQVVKVAESALLTMLEHCLIGADYIESRIWPAIKSRMQQVPVTENTIGVLTVMSKMAPWLGCDQTERLLVPALEKLSSHSEFAVRRVCASLYGDFCAVISTVKTETVLVPGFLRLCADPEFLVRQTCAEAFTSVSCTVTLNTRRTQLASVFARLLSDPVRWVQLAAFQSLGPFITTFAEPSITMLGYNHQGELVLKHPDGFEFRLNSCKVDERYLYTRDSLFAIVMDGNQSPQQTLTKELLANIGVDDDEDDDDQQKNIQSNRQQQDDRNNNHDRFSNNRLAVTEENSSEDIIIDNICWDPEENDMEIYNQFQYWRDPLPDIDGDLNSNIHTITVTTTPSSTTTVNVNSNNNNNNKNNINNSDDVVIKQRLQDLLFEQNIQQQQPQRVKSSLVRLFEEMEVFNKKLVSYESNNSIDTSTNILNDENEKVTTSSPTPCPSPPTPQPSNLSPSPASTPLQDIVPLELIKHFVSMSEPHRDSAEHLAGHCAYNLPAVALTLGPKHWDLLKPAYETLAADRQWKVRRIVASSIHELAIIVGEEVATQDLVPVFNGFIKDLDEVRIAALKHLAHFLKLLRPAGRNSFLPRLTEFLMTDYEWNWRFRQELAEQLLQVLGLFSPADTCHHLTPVVMALLIDRVSEVRKVALQLATELVSHVSIDVSLLRTLLADLAQQFAHSSRWNRRQTFALFCSRLVSEGVLSGEMFARDVLPHLLDLSWDRVPNVRLTVARALANDVIIQPYFSDYSSPHYEVLHSVLKRLQGDKDRDVRYFASQVPVLQHTFPLDVETQYNLVTLKQEPDGSTILVNRPRTTAARQVLK